MKKDGRGDSGFTLMEVLIATAILAIVMAIVYGSFIQTKRVIGKAEGSVEELRGVRAAINRMMRDISMAFISSPLPNQTDDNSNNTFFMGTDDYTSGYPNDSIDFTSYSNRIRNKDAKESDQTEVGYYIKRNYNGKSVLMKREKRRIDSNPVSGGKSYEISEDIEGLNFRYLDQGTWSDSWDSRTKTPPSTPEAVEITIIVKDNSGTDRTYKTITGIPLGKK